MSILVVIDRKYYLSKRVWIYATLYDYSKLMHSSFFSFFLQYVCAKKKKQNNCNIKAEKFNHGSREKTNNRNKLAKYPEVVEIVQFGRVDVVIPTRMVERVKNFI